MEEKTHLYNLGVYLAEYIILTKMPSLSCYQWTNKPIQVTYGEAEKTKKLHDNWFKKISKEKYNSCKGLRGVERCKKEKEELYKAKKEWNEDIKYRYMLKEKYLPHTLKCAVNYIDFSDNEVNKEIKKGFIDLLFNSDFCEYSLNEKDIIFKNEIYTYGSENQYKDVLTFVILKLCLKIPESYSGKDWIKVNDPHTQNAM